MRKHILALASVMLFLPLVGSSQVDSAAPNNPTFHFWRGRPTGTPVNICTNLGDKTQDPRTSAQGNDCYITGAVFATGGSSATITLNGNGTACAGGTCSLMNAVTIQANTTYSVAFFGVLCKAGCSISGTGTVDAHIAWTTNGGYR